MRNAIARHLGLTGCMTGLGQMGPPMGSAQTTGGLPTQATVSSSPFAASSAFLTGQTGWGGNISQQVGGPVMGEMPSHLLEMLQTAVSRSGSIPLGVRHAGVLSPDPSHMLSDVRPPLLSPSELFETNII